MAGGVARRAARRDEQRGGAHGDRLGGHRAGRVEVGERHVARRQQPGIDGAELDHPPVVRPGRADGQLEVAAVLPVVQAAVVERVEHELAGEAEQVERPRPVLGEERPGGGEVLAVHDLRRLGVAVLRRCGAVSASRANDAVEVAAAARPGSPSGAARCRRRTSASARRSRIARVGVVAQPRRRLHDVGVGIVHDQPRRVVPHGAILPSSRRDPRIGRRGRCGVAGVRYRAGPVTARPSRGDVAEWLRQGPAKPCTRVRFPASPLRSSLLTAAGGGRDQR